MYILGINYAYNTSACLLCDGEVVSAAQEERFNREKYTMAFPEAAIRFCLDSAKIEPKKVDHVCFSWNRKLFLTKRVLQHQLEYYPKIPKYFYSCIWWGFYRHYYQLPINLQRLGFCQRPHFLNHHLAHAGSAFFAGPFKKAAILVADGEGEGDCISTYSGDGDNLKLLSKIEIPHSLGYLYEVFASFLGFDRLEGPGKVMGLAALGDYRTYYNFFKQLVSLENDGRYTIDPCIYFYYVTGEKKYLKNIVNVLGEATEKGNGESKRDKDIAAALQKVTEEILLHIAAHLYKQTRCSNIVMAGGIALNGIAAHRIINETPFENIFIQPAADDAGTAMGAALYFYNSVLQRQQKYVMANTFLGPEYTDAEIESLLVEKNVKYYRSKDVARETAGLLAEKNIVAWFQGKMEWGPRALGARSILADPRTNTIKEDLNTKVKHRETYRPFAPSVLEEKAKEYFEIDRESPYMLLVCSVHADKRDRIPAVVHIDGTSRPQTVSKKENPLFYDVIDYFYKLTDVPLILNTSFNIQEPIVCTPRQALETFLESKMDYLIAGNFIVPQVKNNEVMQSNNDVEQFHVEHKHPFARLFSKVLYHTVMGLIVCISRLIFTAGKSSSAKKSDHD